MKQRWKDYEKAWKQGPLLMTLKISMGLFAVFVVMGVLVYGLSWVDEAEQVAKQEFGPRAMLEKYEWFKDASAQLDKKRADWIVYEKRRRGLRDSYGAVPRSGWSRVDVQQDNQWSAEIAGVLASYNDLAAQYNAEMAKVNWRFANVGELPEGVTTSLPREYRFHSEDEDI